MPEEWSGISESLDVFEVLRKSGSVLASRDDSWLDAR